jgi:penicillin-binding protein 1A
MPLNKAKLLKIGLLGGSVVAGVLLLVVVVGWQNLSRELPSVDLLKDVQLQQALRVYSNDGKLIAEYGEKRRIPLPIGEIPQVVKDAFLASEDDRFFEHPGVDYQGLTRAVINQLLKGDRSQGGSTITMQVARNFFLSPEKSYKRKISEILLALRIEKELSKDQILELYLNKIYLGKRAYGVAAAAQVYYGKRVEELSLPEVAMIAGLPKAPSRYNPVANPERATLRRNYVLRRMLADDPAAGL